jgi:hypothetical protein
MKITKSKFNNVKIEDDGFKFDSKKEHKRYCELRLLVKAGIITDLKLQVPFALIPSQSGGIRKELPMVYKADFVYTENGEQVIEDTKGVKTDVYIIKRKLMKLNGNEIREI